MLNNLIGKSMARFMLALGLAVLAAGIFFLKADEGFLSAEARVVKIECDYNTALERNTYTTHIEYSVDGILYESQLSDFKPDTEEGGSIEIRYNPENPGEITAGSAASLKYFIILGAAVAAAGAVVLIRKAREG